MFTVLICDEHIINDCQNKYYIYLKPFLDDNSFVFCKWNVQGQTLDEALPDLKNIIKNKNEWRVVIVNDSSTWDFNAINKRNPFDFVDSAAAGCDFKSFERIKSYRATEEEMSDKALSNPLTKLSVWLCGSPEPTEPIVCYKGLEDVFNNLTDENTYYKKAGEAGLSPDEIELDRCRLMRYEKLTEVFDYGGELFTPPQTVLALSERAMDVTREEAESAWKKHIEFDYSQFYNENLYPEKLRYLLYDVPYIKGEQNENIYFNFLTVILLLATNEVPNGVLRSNRVYAINVGIDDDCVRDLFKKYNAKLKATLDKIGSLSRRIYEDEHEDVDPEEAELCFEAPVTVPVVNENHVERTNLIARYDKIGLSRNCPTEEYRFWDDQYHAISTKFIKYLQGPRRAVRVAVQKTFRRMNKNTDDRALRLDELQRENIENIIYTEEKDMINITTTHLYNTARYKEQLEEADKIIKTGIAQRMTKGQTIRIGFIATLAYFAGFLPLFFSNLNTLTSFMTSLGITIMAMVAFMAIGFGTLFLLRNKLINRIKHFNSVMSGIVGEVEGSLAGFSKYLSHACNIMRGYSVLNPEGNPYAKKQNILNHHRRVITAKIEDVNEFFSGYIETYNTDEDIQSEPFDYDFTSLSEYTYDMPYSTLEKHIEFMQEGNEIRVPVDYLKFVTVKREELYD